MKWNKKRRELQKLYDTKQKLRKQDLKLLVNLYSKSVISGGSIIFPLFCCI